MKIQKVEVKNFRKYYKGRYFVWRYQCFYRSKLSGKSNFLLAISNILKIKNDFTTEFGGNNVTIGKGMKTTTLKVSVTGVSSRTCFIGGSQPDNQTNFFCLEPEVMTFEKILDKSSFSVSHKLIFSGKKYDNQDKNLTWESFNKDSKKFDDGAENVKEEVVYEKKFIKEETIGNTNIVQADQVRGKNDDNYFTVFKQLDKSLIAQVKPKLFSTDLGQITTALSIHKYVTEKGNEQVYQEATKRLKVENIPAVKQSLEDSSFIFLIADIQRNKEIKDKFYKDLNLYTKGIVSEIVINPKGTLSVVSPNGPDGIWTISNGTSVLVFFITLINWLNIKANQRSYQLPHVILLDETDSIVHPTILSEFIELLRALSRKVQVFITTHSPYFLDGFSKKEIYYIKDSSSMAESAPDGMNRCNIYNYESIIKKLSEPDQKNILEKKNSELFCEGIIDNLFPISDI